MTDYDVKEIVKDRYGQEARGVLSAPERCCGGPTDVVSGDLYDDTEAATVPMAALQASLGCGNPTALAELEPGEVVLSNCVVNLSAEKDRVMSAFVRANKPAQGACVPARARS
jgi:hypothetical protein